MVRKIDGIEFNEIENFVCRHCGATEVGYEHLTSNDAIKAYCNCCGSYIRFVKQLNAVPKPATEKQIKFANSFANDKKGRISPLKVNNCFNSANTGRNCFLFCNFEVF